MKLYKFRSLTTPLDLERTTDIIETGLFWCSRFSELNDPMEGVFKTSTTRGIDDVYKNKSEYKICSFSKEDALRNPTLWGYYAGGFKGIAIELVVNGNEVREVRYVNDINCISEFNMETVDNILTTKLTPWKHEEEYRFLKKTDSQKNKIGKITAIYFGNPYGTVLNCHDIHADNEHLREYVNSRRKLIKTANNNGINCFPVDIEDSRVIPNSEAY